jgi:chorismate mutase
MLSPEQVGGWRVGVEAMPKLKVFRTPIGFHDAYVAAPSRKAALKAWGADADLFARGAADQVTDESLMAEPLAHPGEVIKRPRGTAADHLAASTPPPRRANTASSDAKTKSPSRAKTPPRPSRATLTAAEEALDEHRCNVDAEIARLEAERAKLARQIAATRKSADRDASRLEEQRDKARAAYEKALDRWRDG